MTDPIDFTRCARAPNRAYNGANGAFVDGVTFLSDLREVFQMTSHENRRIVWHDIKPLFSNPRSLFSERYCALRRILRWCT